jgi:hypothetical protein
MSELNPADGGGAPESEAGGEGGDGSASGQQSGQENQIHALTRKLRKLEAQEAARLKADQDRKTSELSELDQLKKQLADAHAERDSLKSTTRQQTLQFRFEAAAAKAGAVDPAAAWKLADTTALDLDEKGNVVGLADAVTRLQKSSPYLFTQATPPVTSGGGNPPGGNAAPKLTPEAIKSMSNEDFLKLSAGVNSGAIKI